ncbi:hypothetical protein Dimus_011772 [Dionaea muscipula]
MSVLRAIQHPSIRGHPLMHSILFAAFLFYAVDEEDYGINLPVVAKEMMKLLSAQKLKGRQMNSEAMDNDAKLRLQIQRREGRRLNRIKSELGTGRFNRNEQFEEKRGNHLVSVSGGPPRDKGG